MNTPSYEEIAGSLIQTHFVDGSLSEADLREAASEHAPQVRGKIDKYIAGVRPAIAAMTVCKMDERVAGLCTRSDIMINQSVLLVRDSVQDTVAQTQEVLAHEQHHDVHNHIQFLQSAPNASASDFVVIAGRGFSGTELIEGLTVARTGDQFVSAQYVTYKQNLLSSLARAGIPIGTVEKAVEEGDLTPINTVEEGDLTPINTVEEGDLTPINDPKDVFIQPDTDYVLSV